MRLANLVCTIYLPYQFSLFTGAVWQSELVGVYADYMEEEGLKPYH